MLYCDLYYVVIMCVKPFVTIPKSVGFYDPSPVKQDIVC